MYSDNKNALNRIYQSSNNKEEMLDIMLVNMMRCPVAIIRECMNAYVSLKNSKQIQVRMIAIRMHLSY